MIDSHCHLASDQFDADLDAVIARANAAGIATMVTIADTITEAEKCIAIAEKYEHIFCTVGVHPHEAKSWRPEDVQTLRAMHASSKKIKAIGEIGLDYHYDLSPRDVQRSVFREQLFIANALELPVVVHCREAVEDVWSIVDELKPKTLVLHCCTEAWNDVERFVERGYLLSFTGMVTYKNAAVIRDTVKRCPLEQLMIETDAPYLAPVPYRGKRNEPAFVVEVAKTVAEIKGLSLKEIADATARNAERFFALS